MKFDREDVDYVYATCEKCQKEYKLKWQSIERAYYGYKLKHTAICSCGEPLKKIEGNGETTYCPECAHLNSAAFDNCEKCGHVLQREKTKEDKRKQFMFIAGIVVVLAGMMLTAGFLNRDSIWSLSQSEYSSVTDPGKIKPPKSLGDLYLEDYYGNFLGRLTLSETDEYSLFNPDSLYGYIESGISIWNENGSFGSAESDESVSNVNATKPPKIMYKEKFLGHVTLNENLEGTMVKPDHLREWIEMNLDINE